MSQPTSPLDQYNLRPEDAVQIPHDGMLYVFCPVRDTNIIVLAHSRKLPPRG
jgi:hypothetical protein